MGEEYKALWDSVEMYRLIVDHVRDLVRVFDTQGNFVYASPSHEQVLGYTPSDLTKTSVMDIIHPDDVAMAKSILKDMITNNVERDGIFRYRTKSGRWISLETRGNPVVKDGAVIGVVTVGRDATERLRIERELREYHEQIEFLAYHDPLTSLLNRTKFMSNLIEAVESAEQRGEELAVLFLDCDNFKNINDMWGHHVGDEAIKELGLRIADCVGGVDRVGRFAGDEFTVVLPRIASQHDAVKTAQEILRCTKHPWRIANHEFVLTVSIGGAIYPSDGVDAAMLMKHADKALYRAKKNGKDTYVFYSMNHEFP